MKPLCVSFVEQDPQLAEQVLAHLQSAGMQGHHSSHHDDFQSNKDHEISDVVVLGLFEAGIWSCNTFCGSFCEPEGLTY